MNPQTSTINPKLFVVYLLESGYYKTHGGPYNQSKAKSVRDSMKKHIENDEYSGWNIPKDTAHVVAITEEILWEIKKNYFENVENEN